MYEYFRKHDMLMCTVTYVKNINMPKTLSVCCTSGE